MSKEIISKFETELFNRIKLKETQINSRHSVLLNAFKYFDYQHNGFADLTKFKKVMKIKLNINTFNDFDLKAIYMNYLNELASKNRLDYREFSDYIKNKKNKNGKENSFKIKKNNYTGNKEEKKNKKSSSNKTLPKIDKILENIVFKLRKKNLSIFFELFKEIKKYDVDNLGLILVDDFLKVFNNLDIIIHKDDLNEIGEYFIEKGNLMDYDKLFKCFFLNFNGFRAAQIHFMFGKIDYKEVEKININVLREIFEPKMYYHVKSGRRTPEEIKKAFCYSVDIFKRFHHKEIDTYKFTMFFKFLSSYFEEDMNFKKFIQESFRYNKIIKISKNLEKYENENLLDPVYSDQNPEKLIEYLVKQISQKKNNGFINLLRSLKTMDYGRDNYLYFNEFKKALSHQRIVLTDPHLKIIFKIFSNKSYKLDYWKMLEILIPRFDNNKIIVLRNLYDDLLKNNNINKLQYFVFQNNFNAKSHPDFKNKIKPDYLIKNEFADSLKIFLDNYKIYENYISFETFLRFFEYYARDFSDDYFENMLINCFSKKKRIVNFKSKSKKNESINISSKRKSQYNNDSISRSSRRRNYQDSQNISKSSKMKSQRSIINSRKSRITLKNKKSIKINSKHNQDYLKQNPNAFKKQKKNSQISYKSKTRNLEKDSYTRNLQQENKRNLEMRNKSILSPENRSYMSYEPNEQSAYMLNKQIQNSIVRKEDRIYDNINKEHNLDKNPFSLLKNEIFKSLKYNILLELEYEMTIKSSNKGFIDFKNFYEVILKLKLKQKLREKNFKSIFMSFSENGQMHVQAFVNELRGQMNEEREYVAMDLFEKFCDGQDFIEIDYLRKFFKARNVLRSEKDNVEDVQEMFQFMIDLFYCLNLEIKNRNYFDLDDFLYFFDNFSFFCEKNSQFKQIINKCF